jgi:transposase-like protein
MSESSNELAIPARRRFPRPLEQGHIRWKLIRELGQQELTVTELAARYDVTPGAISQFRDRHQAEVDAVKADIENEFAGLWIASKSARLAEYAADVELINEAIRTTVEAELSPAAVAELEEAGIDVGKIDAALMAAKHRALRSVAEELGHLPTKVQMQVDQVTRVHYTVAGMDPEDLR